MTTEEQREKEAQEKGNRIAYIVSAILIASILLYMWLK